MSEYMRAGYQGKHDPMRALADKLAGPPEKDIKNVYYSKSCAEKDKMRPFKEGGYVKQETKNKGDEMQKGYKKGACAMKAQKHAYDEGGMVFKIRSDKATGSGQPEASRKGAKKGTHNSVYY